MIFQLQNTPPPENWNLGRSILPLCDFSVVEYPPPPRKLKFRQILALCDFPVADYPPPQKKLKFRQILALCDFSVVEYPEKILKFRLIFALCDFSVADYPPPPPRKLKFRQILALCDFSVAEYSPPPKYEIMADLPNGKVCVASYHMWRLYPTRITTRSSKLKRFLMKLPEKYVWLPFPWVVGTTLKMTKETFFFIVLSCLHEQKITFFRKIFDETYSASSFIFHFLSLYFLLKPLNLPRKFANRDFHLYSFDTVFHKRKIFEVTKYA